MSKLNLNDIGTSFQSRQALNENFRLIEEAIDNTVSRDGSTPNQMNADLDLNGNDILNVKEFVLADGKKLATETYVDTQDVVYNNLSQQRDDVLQSNINQKESESIARDNTISQNSNRIETESKQRDVDLGVVIGQKETESIARDFAIDETIVQKESESISRDGFLQNGLTALGAFVNGNFIQKYPNKDFKDVLFPWDIGSLVIGGSVFSIEEISPIRIDLAYGASTKDLGLI